MGEELSTIYNTSYRHTFVYQFIFSLSMLYFLCFIIVVEDSPVDLEPVTIGSKEEEEEPVAVEVLEWVRALALAMEVAAIQVVVVSSNYYFLRIYNVESLPLLFIDFLERDFG